MSKLMSFALAVALSGCLMVGPDYQKLQIDVPKQWRFADKEALDTANLP